MRAIIIDDKDARALLDSLKLEKLNLLTERQFGRSTFWEQEQPAIQALLKDMHSCFHFIVCKWLQDQGASVVR